MKLRDELRVRQLLELMRMENALADRETHHGDGWLYDHAGQANNYSAEIDEILSRPAHSEGQGKEVRE